MSHFKLPQSQKVYKTVIGKQKANLKLPVIVWKLLDLVEAELGSPSLAKKLGLSEEDTQAIIDECLKNKLVTLANPETVLYKDYAKAKEPDLSKTVIESETSQLNGADFSVIVEGCDQETNIVDIDFDSDEFEIPNSLEV